MRAFKTVLDSGIKPASALDDISNFMLYRTEDCISYLKKSVASVPNKDPEGFAAAIIAALFEYKEDNA
jgi:hypothetical protein